MTRRQPPARPDMRDRWSFDDDAPVAPESRGSEPPQAENESVYARADDALDAPFNPAQAARQADPPDGSPVERDLLFQPAVKTVRTDAQAQATRPAEPISPTQGTRFGAGPAQSAAPSPWSTIQVSDKARARAAAAGIHRYVDEKRSSSRASWVIVSTIALLTAGAAFGLYRLAEPQAPALTQSAESPDRRSHADPSSSAIEVPPEIPVMTAPAREAPPGAGRDTPLIEVAP